MLVLLPAVIILLAVIITVQLGCDVPPQQTTPSREVKAGAVFEALWQLQDTTRLHNPLPGDYRYFSEGEVVTVRDGRYIFPFLVAGSTDRTIGLKYNDKQVSYQLEWNTCDGCWEVIYITSAPFAGVLWVKVEGLTDGDKVRLVRI